MSKKNLPAAIETAKLLIEKYKEQVHEAERLLISLELENAIPDIWDHGGSFKIGPSKRSKLPFEYPDGTTLWIPICDLPTSYLESLKHSNRDRKLVRAMGNEIFKRRKAKRDEERASVNSSI
tara:strand:- start:33 stop:398 length:366 start_codon:yes stop_codon:yes gene_type:complete